jgi:hypothetical protein
VYTKIGPYHTVYERGPDEKMMSKKGQRRRKNTPMTDKQKKQKKILGWEVKDLDRVRMEYKAVREKLKKKGIYTLSDLIENPRFMNFNEDRWKLRKFERTNKLPKMWHTYPTEDKRCFAGTLMSEHIKARAMKTLSQHTMKIPEIAFFEKKLDKVMLFFDEIWDGRARII